MNNNNDNRNHNEKDKKEHAIENTAVPDFKTAKEVGDQVEHLKSNEELRKEGKLEDPIQETKEHAEQAADKHSNVKLKRAEDEE